MNTSRLLLLLAGVAGLVAGPSSLASAALSDPPIQWSDLGLVLLGCSVVLLVVFGVESAVGSHRTTQWPWRFFLLSASFLMASGVSAAGVSLVDSAVAPHAFLLLSMGVGVLVGAGLARWLFD
jgi:hypothetical protein